MSVDLSGKQDILTTDLPLSLTDNTLSVDLCGKQDILTTDSHLSLTNDELSILNPNQWITGANTLNYTQNIGIGTANP